MLPFDHVASEDVLVVLAIHERAIAGQQFAAVEVLEVVDQVPLVAGETARDQEGRDSASGWYLCADRWVRVARRTHQQVPSVLKIRGNESRIFTAGLEPPEPFIGRKFFHGRITPE